MTNGGTTLREMIDLQRRKFIRSVEAATLSTRPRRPRRPPRTIVDAPFVTALLAAVAFFGCVTLATYYCIADNSSSDHRIVMNIDRQSLAATVTAGLRKRLGRLHHADPHQPIEKLQHTFPLHVTEETMEVIDHPVVPYLLANFLDGSSDSKDDDDDDGSPAQRVQQPAAQDGDGLAAIFPHGSSSATMRVPMLFDQAYGHVYGSDRIRHYLGAAGRRLMTVEEAQSIGSFDQAGHETIYVSIASYRDWECPLTVTDLYERAEFPERIRVAIIEQRQPDDAMVCNRPEQDCATHPEQMLCKYAHLIEYFEMDSTLGVGPVFARHVAHRYYRGGTSERVMNGGVRTIMLFVRCEESYLTHILCHDFLFFWRFRIFCHAS